MNQKKKKGKYVWAVIFLIISVTTLGIVDAEKLRAQKVKETAGQEIVEQEEIRQESAEQETTEQEETAEQKETAEQEVVEQEVVEQEETSQEIEEQEEEIREKLISVPLLKQYPKLPTGCEATSAAMLLQYYQIDITPEVFASQWLKCEKLHMGRDRKLRGPDPAKVFAGDPFSVHSYGCFAEVITDAINRNCEGYHATTLKGKTLKTLSRRYLIHGKPLLIWATMKMAPSYPGDQWIMEDGTEFTWIAGEHCLVLTGYTETDYLLNDPQTGTVVSYPKEVVEERFEELGCQAVVVEKNKAIWNQIPCLNENKSSME